MIVHEISALLLACHKMGARCWSLGTMSWSWCITWVAWFVTPNKWICSICLISYLIWWHQILNFQINIISPIFACGNDFLHTLSATFFPVFALTFAWGKNVALCLFSGHFPHIQLRIEPISPLHCSAILKTFVLLQRFCPKRQWHYLYITSMEIYMLEYNMTYIL